MRCGCMHGTINRPAGGSAQLGGGGEVVRSSASCVGETRVHLRLREGSFSPPDEEGSHEAATLGVMVYAADAAPSANERPLLPTGTGDGGHAQAVQLRQTRFPHAHGGPTHALPALFWRVRHGAHTSS